MEFEELDKKDKKIEINGVIESGKQYDLDVKLPEDNRDVVFGIIKNQYGDPIADAVVKLIEVDKDIHGEERKPVSHTFTNDDGEFVFGPLCPDKEYAIDIWVDDVRHYKICAKVERDDDCLKGKPSKDCGCMRPVHRPDYRPEEKPETKNV